MFASIQFLCYMDAIDLSLGIQDTLLVARKNLDKVSKMNNIKIDK